MKLRWAILLALLGSCGPACLMAGAQGPSVDTVVSQYVQALGGAAAVDQIQTLQTEAKTHRASVTYYWAKPNKVLRVSRGEKTGFDGGSGWTLSRKRRVTKLSKGEQQELLTDANPIRFAHLKELYPELESSQPANVNGASAMVLTAPNDIGSTKLYFDAASHLLVRIEETGIVSAYYQHVTEFFDYKQEGGVLFPHRIVHSSTEPGGTRTEIRITSVEQNVEIKPAMFEKPRMGAVTLGGKR